MAYFRLQVSPVQC